MSNKIINILKTTTISTNELRVAFFVITVILLVLGAGAPSDGGGLGGF